MGVSVVYPSLPSTLHFALPKACFLLLDLPMHVFVFMTEDQDERGFEGWMTVSTLAPARHVADTEDVNPSEQEEPELAPAKSA